jgi:hypothetical protein
MYKFYEDTEGWKIKKKTFWGWKTLSYGMSSFGECELKFATLEEAEKHIKNLNQTTMNTYTFNGITVQALTANQAFAKIKAIAAKL